LQEKIDLIGLIQTIWRRKLVVIACAIFAGIVALCVSLILPKEYTAETSIIIQEDLRSSQVSGFTARAFGLSGLNMPTQSSASYTQMLRSNTIFLNVINKINLREYYGFPSGTSADQKLIRQMSENLEIEPIRDQVLRLKYADKDPNKAALIANTFIQVLGDFLKSGTKSRAVYTEDFIAQQIVKVKDELSTAEEELKTFSAEQEAVGIDEQITQMVRNAAEIEALKTQDQVSLAMVRNSIKQEKSLQGSLIKRGPVLKEDYREYENTWRAPGNILSSEHDYSPSDLSDLPDQLLKDTAVEQLRGHLTDLKIQLHEQKITKTEKHPEVVKLNEEISRSRGLFISEVGDVLDSRLASLEFDRINLQSQIGAYDAALAGYDLIWKDLPEKNMQYIRKKRDVEALSQVYIMLKSQLAEARIEVVREGLYFDILDSAIAPDKPEKPKPLMNTLTGLIVGFILGIIYIYISSIAMLRRYTENT
jgi:uncharacterized protein involved in exopolysaccharide biosynthesis